MELSTTMEFRKLRANEIDCRVAQISEKGVTLLLYKDARVDMTLLDETVGPGRWQRQHELINGNLFCNVGIWFDRANGYGEWVWKQDVGTESNTEAEKGQASDSFKRACVNWGIGRELYSAPFIWIKATDCEIKQSRNGKLACYDKFKVKSIDYNARREICSLEIINTKTSRVVYSYGAAARHEEPPKEQPKETPKQETQDDVAICADCGKPITGCTWPDGRKTSGRKLAQETFKKYGKCLCGTCYTGLAVNNGNQG